MRTRSAGSKPRLELQEFRLSLRGATGLAHDAVSTLLRLPVLTELDVSGCSRISAMNKMRLVAKVHPAAVQCATSAWGRVLEVLCSSVLAAWLEHRSKSRQPATCWVLGEERFRTCCCGSVTDAKHLPVDVAQVKAGCEVLAAQARRSGRPVPKSLASPGDVATPDDHGAFFRGERQVPPH